VSRAAHADLLAAIGQIVARHTPSSGLPAVDRIRLDVIELFARHRDEGDSPVDAATAWSSWMRSLVGTASDPRVPSKQAEAAKLVLGVAVDLGFDPKIAVVVEATASSVLRETLDASLAGFAAVPRGAVGAATEQERWLTPMRAVTHLDLEAARPTLAELGQHSLGSALERGRTDLVSKLLDGQLAPLHGDLRTTFSAALGEDETSVELFDQHKVALALDTEPLPITRGRLASSSARGAWGPAESALRTLIEFEALAPAGRATLNARLPEAIRVTLDDSAASRSGERSGQAADATAALRAFLATYATLPGGADEVRGARDTALRAALRALTQTDEGASAAAFAGRLERALALGSSVADAVDVLAATLTAERAQRLHFEVLEALATTRPQEPNVQGALDAALVQAAEERQFELLERALAAENGRHLTRALAAFHHVRFTRADATDAADRTDAAGATGPEPDLGAVDLYLRHEPVLEPQLDARQRAELEGPLAPLLARRRMAVALAADDHARIIALVVAGGPAAPIGAVWDHTAGELAVEALGSEGGVRALQLITELRRLGHTPNAAVTQLLHARAARAAAADLPLFRRELDATFGTGALTSSALAATVLDELSHSSAPGPAVWARVQHLQRTLGLEAGALAPFCEQLTTRALARGEDPFVDELAQNPAFAAPVAAAFERWFRERVYTGQEVHRGMLFAARGRQRYRDALPARLDSDGRLAQAVRSALADGPGRKELAQLAIEQAEALGLSHAERVQISRSLLADAQLETPGLSEQLIRHLVLEGSEARHPVCLRAAFLVAVDDRDWDKALPRLKAARAAGALRDSDTRVIAAVEAEVARRIAEDEQYRNLSLAGSWSVVLTIDGVRNDSVTSAVVIPTRDGVANVLRCKLSGKGGDVGMAYSALYRPDARTLALKFDRNMKLETRLAPVVELAGVIRLVEPKGTAFEWTLAPRAGVPAIHMRWTR